MRNLTEKDITQLLQRGCTAEDWSQIYVCEEFSAEQLLCAHLKGRVEIGSGVRIARSLVKNYSIGEGSLIEDVTRLECRHKTSFANGVEVSSINENGGRSIKIYDELRAQTAYIWALYRHEEAMRQRLTALVDEYAASKSSSMGRVGRGCEIIASKIIREADIRDNVKIEGASLIEQATIMTAAYIGVDVKLRKAIVAEGARIDTGATIERCFVGESSVVASSFSALDSLIFSSSHLENGEAASIFAGAYTVSHHKSSLLIAGLFSFFNAGSGSNQSNHLFKSGAVHQAIHPRGCKFASGTYIMAPAVEGAFTMVKGSHSHHHDTSVFPFSYLIEGDGGASILIPASNITSYGTYRDMKKWKERDRRVRRRDVINYEEHNPYLTGAMVRAVNTIHTLQEQNPTANEYMWNRVTLRHSLMRRGLTLYNKAIAASIGDMLSRGELIECNEQGDWCDIAGAYVPQSLLKELIEDISCGTIASLRGVDERFEQIAASYDNYAYSYAYSLLGQLLGTEPSQEQITSAIASAKVAAEEIDRLIQSDLRRDCDMSMSVGYGVDWHDEEIKRADYESVRGLK